MHTARTHQKPNDELELSEKQDIPPLMYLPAIHREAISEVNRTAHERQLIG